MTTEQWYAIILQARTDPALCEALAQFLADNNVTVDPRSGEYNIRFTRPHIHEVKRSGRKHWAVKC